MSHKATSWAFGIPADQLTNSEFRVLVHLCDCHNPSKGCFPTQKYLAEACGVAKSTINLALLGLERKGFIRRFQMWDEDTHKQRPTRYRLGFEIDPDADPEEGSGGAGNGPEPGPNIGHGVSPKPGPNIGPGAGSDLTPEPGPISPPSRVRPVGHVTCKEPVKNPGAGGGGGHKTRNPGQGGKTENPENDRLALLSKSVIAGSAWVANHIKRQQADEMLRRGLVEPKHLRALRIHFTETGRAA